MDQILAMREKRAKLWDATKAFLDSKRNGDGLISAEDTAKWLRRTGAFRDSREIDVDTGIFGQIVGIRAAPQSGTQPDPRIEYRPPLRISGSPHAAVQPVLPLREGDGLESEAAEKRCVGDFLAA